MRAIVPLPLLITLGMFAGANAGLTRAQAEDASEWVRDTHSAIRLLAGSRNGNVLLGGIDIRLDDGWKTYWRTPGDSGVPPRFDFSQSDNVETVTALFPAPMNFPDGGGGTSFGYQKHVVLPLRVAPKDPARPVALRAAISYAVCEKICLPVEATTEVIFSSAASAQDSGLMAALNTVPKPARVGDDGPLTLRDVRRDDKRVLVDVIAPDAARVSLFAEGPTPDWALPVPKPVDRSPAGVIRFAFDLDGLPSGARAEGAALRLTLVGADSAFEYTVTLD